MNDTTKELIKKLNEVVYDQFIVDLYYLKGLSSSPNDGVAEHVHNTVNTLIEKYEDKRRGMRE